MRAALLMAGLLLAGFTARAESEPAASANSNDVQRVARQAEQANQVLREQVKVLEAKVDQLSQSLGDRRGAEKFDTVAEDVREMKRRLDRVERDLSRLQQSVSRLESRR